MLAVIAGLTLRTTKNKKPSFRALMVLNTLEQRRTNKIKYVVKQLQSAHVSHLVQAYAPRLFCIGAIRRTPGVERLYDLSE
jgi:hypothetical protein